MKSRGGGAPRRGGSFSTPPARPHRRVSGPGLPHAL